MAEYNVEIYRLNVADGGFTRLADIITYENLEFFSGLNRIGGCTFVMKAEDPACDPTVLKLERVVLIKRNGFPVWVGRINYIEGEYGSIEGVDGIVTFRCLDYLSFLEARFTSREQSYVNLDASEIATALIDYTQALPNGNLNITEGTIQAVGISNDTLEYQSIAQALINQSDNIIGYDFYFTPIVNGADLLQEVQFNVVQGRGRYRNDLPAFKVGDNVQSVAFATQSPIYNTTTLLGNGTGDAILTSTAEDEGSQQAYTRKERILKVGDYRIQENLDAAAVQANNETKVIDYNLNLQLVPESNLEYGTFDIGDVLNVDLNVENTFIQFTGTARIIELNVRVDDAGAEIITPKIEYYA